MKRLIFVLLSQCRENKFGQEIYRLCIFNFLTTFTNAFLVSYPKKWVWLTAVFSLCGLNETIRVLVLSLWGSVLHYSRYPPRLFHRLLQEKYPSSRPARLLGNQYFLIQFNVLDLVYIQTVSWVGVYYCPLLPLLGTFSLTATFYINKVAWSIDYTRLHVYII